MAAASYSVPHFTRQDGGFLWRLNMCSNNKSGDDQIDEAFDVLRNLAGRSMWIKLYGSASVDEVKQKIQAWNAANALDALNIVHPQLGPLQLRLSGRADTPLFELTPRHNTLVLQCTGIYGMVVDAE